MRRVRRDAKPSLPKLSSSKKAPSLFSAKSTIQNKYANNDEEKKSLARNVTPLNSNDSTFGNHEVGIHMPDPFDFPPSSLNKKNSIDEINRQRKKTGLMVKIFMFLCLITFALTRTYTGSWRKQPYGEDGDSYNATVISKVKKSVETANENSDKKDIVNKIMAETMSGWQEENPVINEADEVETNPAEDNKAPDGVKDIPARNKKTKAKKVKKNKTKTQAKVKDKKKVLDQNDKNIAPTETKEGMASTEDDTLSTADDDDDATNLRESKQENKPQLSGGIKTSFTMKEIPDLPESFGNFADLSAKYDPDMDIPFFWDIHLGGGTVVEHVLGKCLELVQASELGMQHTINDTDFDETLQVVDIAGEKYLNVDTTTPEGIARVQSLGMLSSDVSPSVVYSPMLHEMGPVFTPAHRGRMFALFRHPIERSVGMYYYLQNATWDHMYNPTLANMTMTEYATSASIENNWMTRFLVDKRGGKLSTEDLSVAKEIVRRKCLVGLFEETAESLVRFERFFRWKISDEGMKCQKKVIETGDKRHNHLLVEEGSDAWEALLNQNVYDMELYAYVQEVYKEQGKAFKKKNRIRNRRS